MLKVLVEFSSVDLQVAHGVNGVCPEQMVELSGLVELPVAELSGALVYLST